MSASLVPRAIEEIVQRHRFFVRWFNGEGPDEALAASLSAFAADFVRIAPDGAAMDKPALAAFLAARRARSGGAYGNRVEGAEAVFEAPDAVLVAYLEHQSVAGAKTCRRSTALFLSYPEAPHGVLWRHLQETAMVAAGAGAGRPNEKDRTR